MTEAAHPDGKDATIFDKILAKEIPSATIYEDDFCYAFKDINPQAPVHILLIPKIRDGLTQLRFARDDQAEIVGKLMIRAAKLGEEFSPEGYRLIINDGPLGGQTVYHVHVHIVGGKQMGGF